VLFLDSQSKAPYTIVMDQYFKIRVNSLNPDKPITFDLYIYIGDHHVLYLRAGAKLPQEKLASFQKKNTDVFYVLEKDRRAYKDYVSEQLHDTSLDKKRRGTILKESTFSLIEELFENPNM